MSKATKRKKPVKRDPEFSRFNSETVGKTANKLLLSTMVVVSLIALLPVLPQWGELQKIEAELDEVLGMEHRMFRERERYESEERAIRENPFYLESRARDRLHLHKPGENVVEIR